MKIVEIDDEKRLVQFYDKRMSQEIAGDFIGEEYKGYVFRCVRCAVRRADPPYAHTEGGGVTASAPLAPRRSPLSLGCHPRGNASARPSPLPLRRVPCV